MSYPETWYLEPLDPPATEAEIRLARRVLRQVLREEAEGRTTVSRDFFSTSRGTRGRLLRMYAVEGTPLLVMGRGS